MDPLVVELNRGGPHSIDVAAPAYHAEEPFEVVLDNHGAALHVYLQLDDDLAEAVTLGAVNHFVEKESTRRVRVDVNLDEAAAPIRGRLKIVTGYGSQTEFVTVTVDEPDEDAGRVEVDESLATPRPAPKPGRGESLVDRQSAPTVALGVLAVVVALLAALAVGADSILLAVLVVLIGVAVGGVLLTR